MTPTTPVADATVVSAGVLDTRLVGASAFKQAMSESGASLGIIASTFIYESVIRHGPDLEGYSEIPVQVKETSQVAWMKLFGAARPECSLLTDVKRLTVTTQPHPPRWQTDDNVVGVSQDGAPGSVLIAMMCLTPAPRSRCWLPTAFMTGPQLTAPYW